MLKKLEIENYHGFKEKVILDFSDTKKYRYAKSLIKKGLVKNSVVFGKNGSGKSSLCFAIMDITLHLVDKQKDKALNPLYTNIGNDSNEACFQYTFQFGNKEVVYRYKKVSPLSLSYEKLSVNGKTILVHDYKNESKNFVLIPGTKHLQTKGMQPELSCVKYVYNNTIHDENSELSLLMNFVSGMLYFRSLREGNEYVGFKLGGENLDSIILRSNRLSDFNQFLRDLGLSYDLIPARLPNDQKIIGVKFENGQVVALNEIASSGTQALKLFFCWFLDFPDLSFLIIDEFDAFYSYETAQAVLRYINSNENMQSLVTTHNVTLLNTDCTRPDCAFLLDESGIQSLSSRYKKDLRKGNNIEKMYRDGEFSLQKSEKKNNIEVMCIDCYK